jgi:hypothetical protein
MSGRYHWRRINHRLGMVSMQKLRVLGLGLLIVTAGCADDRQVVGDATGGLPSSTGGQTGTHLSAGGNSAGTGSGLGGTRATSSAGATSLAGSGGNSAAAGSGSGGAPTSGGSAGTSLAGSGGNSGGPGSGLGGTKATGGVGGKTTAGSGGTKATGGTAGAAGTIADETCTAGPVQLLVTTSTPSAYCLESCGGFISILTSDNQPFVSLNADPCTLQPLCSTCSAPICTDRYCGPVVMSRSSAGANWQGEYNEASTCGQNVACSHGRCITSGHYIARFCATLASSSGTCDASATRTCVDAPFDFPTTTTVQAVLPAIGAAGGTSVGGASSTSTGGRTGTGGTVGSGGTAATGGALGSGGSTSTGTAAGGVCNSGCTQRNTSTDSSYCATPNATLTCMGPFPSNLDAIMTANGCTNIPIGSIAYCCPTAILTQCQ